jgi:hypothetical protein
MSTIKELSYNKKLLKMGKIERKNNKTNNHKQPK